MRRGAILLFPLLLAGCGGAQSMTGGDGSQGRDFNTLFVLFVIVTGLVFLVVLAFLAAAIFRRRREAREGGERRLTSGLLGWIGATALLLAGLAVASWFADRNLDADVGRPDVEVEIIAHQWWWEVRYNGTDPAAIVHTANELHLPVGARIRLILKSDDVIHSFWVPNLAGKQDLIPGRTNDMILQPLRAGLYRGQCAEFCGAQHAHMALDVIVESPAAFAAWEAAQNRLPPTPATPLQQAGYTYVTTRSCATCHSIAGTPASGQTAPDLSHLASRRSIAAGTFPMTRGHLYAWVADPQSAKPGNNMPTIGLEPAELNAIIAYLETLR